MNAIVSAVLASLFLGVVATTGDWVWASQGLRHKMLYGLIHGAVFIGAMGLVVGVNGGRAIAGLAGGLVAGVLAAASYYAFALVLGGRLAILAAWATMWLLLACLDGAFLRKGRLPGALVRGVLAAAGSTAAFYYVTAVVWSQHGRPDLVEHFWRWTVGFLPGFLALLVAVNVQVRRTGGR